MALHGSWNRSLPDGYKVIRVDLSTDGTRATGSSDLLTSFIANNSVMAGPSTPIQLPR